MAHTLSSCGHRRPLCGFWPYLLLFAALFVCYTAFFPHVELYGSPAKPLPAREPYEGDINVRLAALAALSALFFCAGAMSLSGRMTPRRLVLFLMAAGAVLRFSYMLYTPFYVRGHDVSTYDGYGHIAYILRLFELKGLPDSNAGQFYHPPLSHAACALSARLYSLFSGERNLDTVLEAARLVPCFASCALMVVSHRLLSELGLSDAALAAAMAVISFHPTFILLSSSVNNDMVAILFMAAGLLYAVRWYKRPTYKNALSLAVSAGCAASAKFSGALIAVLAALVFFAAVWRARRNGDGLGPLCRQGAAFFAVFIPLGMWYHVRNLLLFGQPLGYVAELPPGSLLYVGDVPFQRRFLEFSLLRVLTDVFCDPYTDFRVWEYVVRCALFGEFTFTDNHRFAAAVLIASSLMLIALSLYSMASLTLSGGKWRLSTLALFSFWAVLMASFLYFNIKYPFGCTMDFRYIAPTVLTGAAFIGLFYDRRISGLPKGRRRSVSASVFSGLVALFCASSAAFYLL